MTVLNLADALKLGSLDVDKVMLGSTELWTPGGGSPAVTLRGSRLSYSASARNGGSAFPVDMPVEAQVGDLLLVTAGASWDVQGVVNAGWTELSRQNGSWFNGGAWYKVAEAADLGSPLLVNLYDWTPASGMAFALESPLTTVTVPYALREASGSGAGAVRSFSAGLEPGGVFLHTAIQRLDSGTATVPTINRGLLQISADENGNTPPFATVASLDERTVNTVETSSYTLTSTSNGLWLVSFAIPAA